MPQNLVEPIQLEVTLEDYHGGGEGEYRIKFEAPENQGLEAIRCGFLGKQQCYLMVKPTKDVKASHLAVAVLNSFTLDVRTGGWRIGFKTTVGAVTKDVMNDLAMNYAGADEDHQHTFWLKVVSQQDVNDMRKQRAIQVNVSDEAVAAHEEELTV